MGTVRRRGNTYYIDFHAEGKRIRKRIGKDKKIAELAPGYTELLQRGYRQEDNEEWITYLNWTTEESDLVTFYVVDGKVKGWKEE